MSLFQLDVLQMATGNVTKIQKIHLQVLPKYTPKQPLKMSQKYKKIFLRFKQVCFKIATGNVTKNSIKIQLRVLSKYTPKQPLKMSQKIQKNIFVRFKWFYFKIATGNVTKNLKKIFLLFAPGSREFCHWKCHKKFEKNSFPLVNSRYS